MANLHHALSQGDDGQRPHTQLADGCRTETGCCRIASLLRHDLVFLLVAMVCGAAIRLDFMRAADFVIDADEAIVGLMGKHILEGRDIPVFYYGQHYMGSLEAILASVSFRLFGISSFSLQLVPLVFSIALIPLMYLLGRECGGARAGRVAALLMAIPPAGLVVWSSKARGGFIEIVFIGVFALYLVARWSRAGWLEGGWRGLVYPLSVGFVLGVGWWVNNQIIYFIGPIGVFVGAGFVRALLERPALVRWGIATVLVGSLAFFIGSAPYWVYNITRGFPSMGMFGFAAKREILQHGIGLWTTALPILLGAKRFWSASDAFPHATAVCYGVYGGLCALFLLLRWRTVGDFLRGRASVQTLPELLVVVIGFSFLVFVSSTFGWLVQAPRYLLPVYGALFVVCGVVIDGVASRSPRLAKGCVAALLAINLTSSYLGGRAVAGEPVVFNGERVMRDHAELISTLQSLGISHVRTNYWIGYRLAFETGEGITFSVFEEPHQVRIPEYEEKVPFADVEQVPLVVVPSEADLVRQGLTTLSFSFKEVRLHGYHIFYDLAHARPDVVAVAPEVIAGVAASGPLDAAFAVDGDPTTRWGTAGHQEPGQFMRATFREPIPLRGFEYRMEGWRHDYPRGLEIDLEFVDGSHEVALDQSHFRAVQYFLHDEATWHVFFPNQKPGARVRSLTLRQTGSHPVLDWSVAELRLLMDRSGAGTAAGSAQ